MKLKPVQIDEFSPRVIDMWDNQWFLLTGGDYKTGEFNTMTVAWGSLGVMWNRQNLL